MTQEQLVAAAVESGLNLVELTGGEPLMQKNVSALAAELIRLGKTVLMETNGSCDCSVLPPEVHRIIDYKTPCSGEESAMLEQNFRSLRPHDQVKFFVFYMLGRILVIEAVLMLLPFVFWWLMGFMMRHTEEKWLRRLYGAEYDAYCRRVNRTWPWFPKK